MQPLRAMRRGAPRPEGRPADPAPSRLSYRMQRLALTPAFWRLVRLGTPLAVLAVILGVTLGDPARRQALQAWAQDVKTSIQERPEFMVRLLAIDGATPELDHDIRELLPLNLPVSSFDLDLPGMQAKLAALDPVARADLRVKAGGVLQVSVLERVPAAVWRVGDRLVLLDAEGHRVRDIAARHDRGDLPLIAGAGAEARVAEALALVDAARPLSDRLRGLVRMGERRWDLVLDRGQRVMLPEARPAQALDQVIALDQAQDVLAREVTRIDMRNPRRPTLRMGAGAADAMRDLKLIEFGGHE